MACKRCQEEVPTEPMRFRQNVGKAFMLIAGRVEGPFCDDCGAYWFRRMTRTTLVKGWWSPQSLIVAPWFIVGNLWTYRKVARLRRLSRRRSTGR